MEFEVLQKTDTTLEIKVKDADDTVMYPLMEQLLKDKDIIMADYSVEHQELDDPVVRIEVEEGNDPKKKLVDISNSFTDDIKKVYSDIFEEEE